MPDRYWVGGTANWDNIAGTKWSATSGGPGGASVPTSADDVFFNAASGTGTVTIASGNTGARSINCTGFTGTITGTTLIAVSGSVTLAAAMTWSHTGTVSFLASGILTTAGKTFSAVTVNGSGITLTLGDALNISTRVINVNNGTFTTANFSVTAGQLTSNNPATRVINLGSSTVTLSAATPIAFGSSGLTVNAGTSLIDLNSASASTFSGAGFTFHNVAFTGASTSQIIVNGANIFNNLSFAGPVFAGIRQVQLNDRQIVNGTFSTTGTAGNRRIWFLRPSSYGIALPLLTINGNTTGLADADFRDVVVTGTAAPISGTRIGDLRGNTGITFSAPKRVFRIGADNWSDNQWAATSGGGVSTDNFPLAQDTAVFDNSTTVGTHTMNSAVPYCGTVDMGARTTALTLSISSAFTVYGDWINGSGTTLTGSATLTFSGRNTQTITSAGKTFSGSITVDSFGGYVELGDALSIGGNTLIVTNGTFDTGGFNVTAAVLSSSIANVRSILLRSSTLTLSFSASFTLDSTNLTFDAGTSQINLSSPSATFSGAGLTYHNLAFTNGSISNVTINGNNTFNNVSVTPPGSTSISSVVFNANQTINGTFTVNGGSPIRRLFVISEAVGTPRTLTVGTLAATDCDFRDITIAGAAAGSSPTRAGDCGGNSGITFPAPKTVYWNLAGTQNWSATGWALSSAGTPDINNFPLAQDTVVFDNAGAAGTVTFTPNWNVGTLNLSTRTTIMTFNITAGAQIHGDVSFGSGIILTGNGSIQFRTRGTSTITSGGKQFGGSITIDCGTGTVQLADALSIVSSFTVTSGTFDAVSYNVTAGTASISGSTARTVKMGSGTWTLTGTGTVWNATTTTNLVFNPGTATIVLSDTSTTGRSFAGGALYYNKLTIGGTTGISTLTITGNNTFGELASTKTVAHTIALGTTAQTFGAWTVTGTAGNVVTLTGTGTSHILAGACTSGINYLAMGSIGFAATSPGEFYAGANSGGTAGVPVYRTAKPADADRYWVGGTGSWSSTARWSNASGGSGGFSVPRSHDNVIFNSASNATAYTATVDTVTGGARCKSLTIAGPASGNVTLAGTATLFVHNNVTLPATGLTRTYTGSIVLTGSTTGRTLTTNGNTLASAITINGIGCEWLLGGALSMPTTSISVQNGTFDLNGASLSITSLNSNFSTSRTIKLGSSAITLNNNLDFGTSAQSASSLTFDAGTSTITLTTGGTFNGNGKTFYNVTGSQNITTVDILGTSSGQGTVFNDLTITGRGVVAGLNIVNIGAPFTITVNNFNVTASADPARRIFVRSGTFATAATISCNTFSATNADFRDITIAGAAAPASGTRIGDCKGNSGITFPAGVSKYWNLAGGGNWSATAWTTTSGGTPAANNFPLAQDTCVFEATGLNSGATVAMNHSYNVGTVDMSARTTNTMTFNSASTFNLHGDWINGTGTTISGTSTMTFTGRSTQTITSAGRPFTQTINIQSPNGAVVLLDAFSTSAGSTAMFLAAGTFNANNFNVTFTNSSTGSLSLTASLSSTIAIGNGTWTFATGGTAWVASTTGNLTVTGNGTITMTSGSPKIFDGGNRDYSGITLNHNGAGTLTIQSNNAFRDIITPRTATSAATISLGTTTQRLAQFRGKGESGRQLTITGTSSTSPCTIIYTGTGYATNSSVDFLTLTGVRAYVLQNTWYAGNNSINDGTLGWTFAATPGPAVQNGGFLMLA